MISFINFISFHYLPATIKLTETPLVSVLIPARNEELNIKILLSQLNGFSYTPLEIIVYDDGSEDATADIVKQFAQDKTHIRLIPGESLPEGWLGKNYACHRLAMEAKGNILLFLDADVMVRDGLIERSIRYVQKHDLYLLSIFPKQIFQSFGEKITVPLMNWILLSFLPLILIRKSKNPAFSAANGQFMLFRAKTYKNTLPHDKFKASKVEDIAIIKYFKKRGFRADTLLGDNDISCRMYSGAKEAITGFTKNIFQFFGNSIILTVLVGLITSFGPLLVYYYFGYLFGIACLLGIVFIRVMVSLASKQSVIENILLTLIQHIVFLVIIGKGIANYKRKELIWKGRNILQD
jgi:glycosyltransferase involved in cell wall biosynthesis